ncbi:MAG: hypothetical protein WAX69_06300 [Victivallales bacterium]
MKKLIAVVGICMLGYILPAAAENSTSPEANAPSVQDGKRHCDPAQIVAKIDERLKKLEEHKAKATSNGKTDISNAVQGVIDALNNVKSAINAKDKAAGKAAREQLKTAREALKALIPEKVKERHANNKNKNNTSSTDSAPKL